MARTKQTARRSTGGRAPRRQLATRAAQRSYSFNQSSSNDHSEANSRLQRQLDLYKEDKSKRTITVEGTSELMEAPDLVYLSFKTTAEAATLQGAICSCMDKITNLRSIAVNCGVANSNIASDSIGTRAKKIEYGRNVSPTKQQMRSGYYNKDEKIWKAERSKIVFEAEAVVRITLQTIRENDDNEENKDDNDEPKDTSLEISKLFSKVCYSIMNNSDGSVVMNDAPVYELSDITHFRNEARKAACFNAKEKATFIIDALEDDSVKLGKPICFTDVHIDLKDDAEDSFLGNFGNAASPSRTVRIDLDEEDEDTAGEGNDSEDDSGGEPPKKKSGKRKRTSDGDDEDDEAARVLGDEEIASIFTVPPIRVAACIKAVFEIDTETSPASP